MNTICAFYRAETSRERLSCPSDTSCEKNARFVPSLKLGHSQLLSLEFGLEAQDRRWRYQGRPDRPPYLKATEEGMAVRIAEACDDLLATGKTISVSV